MEDNLEELTGILSISPLSIDILWRITLLIEQQTYESLSSFVSQSFQSLLTLEHWAWQRLSHDSHQWITQPNYLNLFHALAAFNKNLIFNYDNNEDEAKASLLIPNTIDQVNGIFGQIDYNNNDNDPFLAIINLWLDNLSFFIYEYPQFVSSPIISHINQYIGRHYLMTAKFKFYLTQLQQAELPQSVFSTRQLFYIKTCSFFAGSYLSAASQNLSFTAEAMLHHIDNEYLQIVNIHSQTIGSWNKKLLPCITHLTGFLTACYWWTGEKLTQTKDLLLTEQTSCDLAQALTRIISYQPFYKEIKAVQSNDETILIYSILRVLLDLLQKQNISWFLRSNTSLSDVLLIIAENSPCERISLNAYGALGEILTDEKLKELNVTDAIGDFFHSMLLKAWRHPSKNYPRISVLSLLRGKSLLNIYLKNSFAVGFSFLSKSDAIQQKTANINAIPIFFEMCDQYPISFDIIWALSFNKDIQQQLRSNSVFMSKLSHLAKDCDNEQMRKMTHGILWNLESNHEDRSASEIQDGKTFDIMISYSHKDKLLCIQIYEELIKAGYRVWIDFDQMHGNVMDAMAQAIERSHTIIICISEQYQRSNYCRAEAHYAFQRQRKIVPILFQKHYKPDGWLLFLIGQLLYIDFTKHEFNPAMKMLFKELKSEDIPETIVVAVQSNQHTVVTSIPPPKLVLRPILSKNILEWSQTQVQEWLVGHNLIQMSNLLNDCNGRSLLYFHDFIQNGDIKHILILLQEESLRKTGETLSLTEFSRFRSVIDEQRRPLDSNVARANKRSLVCCRMM